jgi:hypothetical protein
MFRDEHTTTTQSTHVMVELDHEPELSPGVASAILADSLDFASKRLGTALRVGLETPHVWWQAKVEVQTAEAVESAEDRELVAQLKQQRPSFVPRFQEVFAEAFRARIQGARRAARRQAAGAQELKLLEEGDLSGQVALRQAIRDLHDRSREEIYALNFRVRVLLRERADIKGFDNPFGPDYICDALGTVCRGLWSGERTWRPIMERLIRYLTPHVATLYRELNGYLQDRDVLPKLRVRLRGQDSEKAEPKDKRQDSLYEVLHRLVGPGARTASPAPATGGGGGRAEAGAGIVAGPPGAVPPALRWEATREGEEEAAFPLLIEPGRVLLQAASHAVQQVLDAMQRGSFDAAFQAAGLREAVLSGERNVLPRLKAALGDRMNRDDRIVLDILSGIFDCVYQHPMLGREMKGVIGQLQIPLLKVALLDHKFFNEADHPARALVEALAEAGIGLEPDREDDRALLEGARAVVTRVREEFVDDVSLFFSAQAQLDACLDADRERVDQSTSEAVHPLLQEDVLASMRTEIEAELAARLVGQPVPLAIRTFLLNEWLDRLVPIYREHGASSYVWQNEINLVSDLIWSLTPKYTTSQRKRLTYMVPKLVQVFSDGKPVEEAEPRRKAFLAALFMRHIQALRGSEATGAPAPNALAAASGEEDQDEHDQRVASLVKGDWLAITKGADGGQRLAKLVWRSSQRKRLLFIWRNGETARIASPDELAHDLRDDRVQIVGEVRPLFERAFAEIIARYQQAADAKS